MDDLSDPDSIEEVEALWKKKNLGLLNLSEFIKHPDYSNAPASYNTAFADNFSDLISHVFIRIKRVSHKIINK